MVIRGFWASQGGRAGNGPRIVLTENPHRTNTSRGCGITRKHRHAVSDRGDIRAVFSDE
jgi:hypothetical protein